MTSARYAIYYAPDARDPLTQAAEHWIGHSAWRYSAVDQIPIDGLSGSEFCSLTASPRRYGFHATLKAPFRLADRKREAELDRALLQYSSECEPVTISTLALRWIGPFLALVPQEQSKTLADFAMNTVRHFEAFRAPLNDQEMERRLRSKPSPRQTELLKIWGYPYVDDKFRFHMTLTGNVPDDHRHSMENAARSHFADFIGEPLTIDRLALFKQPGSDQPFLALRSFPFAGALRKPVLPKTFTTVDS